MNEAADTALVIHSRALLIMPGIIAARRRGDYEGVKLLQGEFMQLVDDMGIPHCYGLSALFVAATKIADLTMNALAAERGISHEELSTSLSLNLARCGLDG